MKMDTIKSFEEHHNKFVIMVPVKNGRIVIEGNAMYKVKMIGTKYIHLIGKDGQVVKFFPEAGEIVGKGRYYAYKSHDEIETDFNVFNRAKAVRDYFNNNPKGHINLKVYELLVAEGEIEPVCS